MMTLLQWFLVAIGILMSALGSFFLKIGAIQIEYGGGHLDVAHQVLFNWRIFAGVLMYFFPVLIWIYLLKRVELSFLQPLFSLVYVVTPILAHMFLNENVSPSRWGGIAVIIIGVAIVARS